MYWQTEWWVARLLSFRFIVLFQKISVPQRFFGGEGRGGTPNRFRKTGHTFLLTFSWGLHGDFSGTAHLRLSWLYSIFYLFFFISGSLFSATSSVEILFVYIGSLILNSLYPKSLKFDAPGFVFFLAATLMLVPFALTLWVPLIILTWIWFLSVQFTVYFCETLVFLISSPSHILRGWKTTPLGGDSLYSPLIE